jgi:adenylosuccinate synthase
VDLDQLDTEILRVEEAIRVHDRIDTWTLHLDSRCHVKTREHRDRDAAEEAIRIHPIGTTLSGNGPAYSDKFARSNSRVCDVDIDRYRNVARKAIIHDTSTLNYDNGLVEGAHGIMLDIDHGTYPFVTSSACTAAAAYHSLGISPHSVGRIIGVMKPYVTRVGAGAFPTEISEETTRTIIRERGHEYGTNTKRPRRIGWLDLPALSYAVRVSGISELAMCKVDILDYLDDIGVCVAYEGMEPEEGIPAANSKYVKPVYMSIRWNGMGLARLVSVIERSTGIPISIITDKESVLIR